MTNIPLSTAEIEELRRLEKTRKKVDAAIGTFKLNAAFIARSRAALPALLDEVEQSRALIEEMAASLREFVDFPLRYEDNMIVIESASHGDAMKKAQRARQALFRATALKEGRT